MPSYQPQNLDPKCLVICCSSIFAISTFLWFLILRRKINKSPNEMEFIQIGEVNELYIYPIKSCKGNKVNWLDCGERGSCYVDEHDRQFLVVDALQDNLFLTARIYPKLVLIEAHVRGGTLTVRFPAQDDIAFTARSIDVDLSDVRERREIRRARLFGDKRTDGLDCGDAVGRALEEFLGLQGKRQLRLIYFAGGEMFTERDASSKPDFWANNPVPSVNDKINFHDLASYMAFSLASVDDLNSHLAAQGIAVDQRNFRPNLVLSGLPPFDEDSWLQLRVGDAEFVCYKPCTRCVLTTVDPDSGVKNDRMEPLRELRKYRLAPGKLLQKYKESPVFGVNMAIVKAGRVRVGDQVWIRYKPCAF